MSLHSENQTPRLRTIFALWSLLLLFILRVVGQLLVAFDLVTFLPPMGAWYSGLIPYPQLVACQAIIIVLYMKVCIDYSRGKGFFVTPRPKGFGIFLLIFGALYFFSMIVRYVVTMTLYPQKRWTGGAIPIFFHLVLASFILVVGRDYYNRSSRATKDEKISCPPQTIATTL